MSQTSSSVTLKTERVLRKECKMPTKVNEFDIYDFSLSGGGGRIACYKGLGNYVGEIRFSPEEPTSTGSLVGDRITVRMSSSMLPAVMQILREEKPLRLRYQDGQGSLTSGNAEPIGEEEGAAG